MERDRQCKELKEMNDVLERQRTLEATRADGLQGQIEMASNNDLIEKNKALAMQLGVALKNTASLKSKLSKQTSDVVELQARDREFAMDLEELKKAAADRRASDTRHRQTTEQLRTENDRLKKEIASSQNDNAFLEAKMKERTDHIFLIREDIVTLQQREQSAIASITALDRNMEAARTRPSPKLVLRS